MKNRNVVGSKYQIISSSSEFYDDCPVCKLMKKADEEGRGPTKEEMEAAFTKANLQN